MGRRAWLKGLGGLLALLVLAAAGGYLWLRFAPRSTPAGQPPLARLDDGSLQGLRDAFNAHAGATRILVMLSPT